LTYQFPTFVIEIHNKNVAYIRNHSVG